jgi:hypothetical protein
MMKKTFYILLAMALLASCKKNKDTEITEDPGTVQYKINFNTDKAASKSTKLDADTLYTQFGNYITSLTPSVFIANIWTVGYVDKVSTDSSYHNIQYMEQNFLILPPDDPSRIVNFSENKTITYTPLFYGGMIKEGHLTDEQVDFKYFYFMPQYLYQEVQLPAAYQTVQLDMFPSGSIVNNVLKVRHAEMLAKILPHAQIIHMLNFYFGNTDSTFVVNPNAEIVPTSENNPVSDSTIDLIIRSNKYTNMIYNPPSSGRTIVMNGVLSVNIEGLIQVYAGADNVPYTSDDVIVYAPKFWERIDSRLDIN